MSKRSRLAAQSLMLTALKGCCSAHNFDNFFRDLRLARAVHRERQRLDHVTGIVSRRLHRGHARGMLGRNRFQQRVKNLTADVLRQQRSEQLLRWLLVDVIDSGRSELGSMVIDLSSVFWPKP